MALRRCWSSAAPILDIARYLLIANTEKRYHAGAAPMLGITQKLVVCQHWMLVLRRCWFSAAPMLGNTPVLVVCQHWNAVLRWCLASAAPVVCQPLVQCWSAALALLTGYNRNGTTPVVRIGSTPIFPPGLLADPPKSYVVVLRRCTWCVGKR